MEPGKHSTYQDTCTPHATAKYCIVKIAAEAAEAVLATVASSNIELTTVIAALTIVLVTTYTQTTGLDNKLGCWITSLLFIYL